MSIAERMFDGFRAEGEVEEYLQDAGALFARISFDEYDGSLEIIGAHNDLRLSVEVQKFLHEAGFQKVYVNHHDKWETHYTFGRLGVFNEVEGWRVRNGRKHGEKGPTLVEKFPPTWPQEWLASGSVVVVTKPCDSAVSVAPGQMNTTDPAPQTQPPTK